MGRIFSRVHMGKFCPGRWDVFCHVITGARIFERVNFFCSANSFQHAQLAIFHPGRWDGLFIRDSRLVRRQSVWPGSWELGSLVPGSHRAGQLASSYERNNVFVWIIGVQRDLAQAGHPTYRAHMNRPLGRFE